MCFCSFHREPDTRGSLWCGNGIFSDMDAQAHPPPPARRAPFPHAAAYEVVSLETSSLRFLGWTFVRTKVRALLARSRTKPKEVLSADIARRTNRRHPTREFDSA